MGKATLLTSLLNCSFVSPKCSNGKEVTTLGRQNIVDKVFLFYVMHMVVKSGPARRQGKSVDYSATIEVAALKAHIHPKCIALKFV